MIYLKLLQCKIPSAYSKEAHSLNNFGIWIFGGLSCLFTGREGRFYLVKVNNSNEKQRNLRWPYCLFSINSHVGMFVNS